MTADAVEGWLAPIAALERPCLLAFDVDGTLAPIVARPEEARVPAPAARALRTLAKTRGMRVALVTGRDARSLSRVVRVPGAWRAVEHGRVVLAPGQRVGGRLDPEQRQRLEAFTGWAEQTLVPRGAQIEAKAASRGIHVRSLAARDAEAAIALLDEAARAAKTHGLIPRRGRAVLEAELEKGDKGQALEALHRRTRSRGVLYVGDDLTDHPAIRKAVALGGLGLFVRSSERPRAPRGASGSLPGPEAVTALLVALASGRAQSTAAKASRARVK